jgi:hypothetical protein
MTGMTRLMLPLTLILCLLLVACGGEGDDNPVPTLLELPSLTPTGEQVAAAGTPGGPTLPASFTPTLTLSVTPSPTLTGTQTVTPSATITDTPTRTLTATASPTNLPLAIGILADMARNATVLPATYIIPTATGDAVVVIPPPNATGGLATPLPSTQCQYMPGGGFGQLFINEPNLVTQIGCPVGAPPVTDSLAAASQNFERGSMIWVDDATGHIYVLFNSGTFMRFDDTFNPATDPESGGMTPPSGLLEPVRGFGKVWRTNSGVRDGLGWATGGEAGTTAIALDFSSGRMLYLPSRGDILILTYEGSPASGTWRAAPGRY